MLYHVVLQRGLVVKYAITIMKIAFEFFTWFVGFVGDFVIF